MRALNLTTILAALALTTGTVNAQQAVLVGTKRAEVRVNTRLEMPVLLHLVRNAEPTRSTRGNGYTEYQVAYTVAANTGWALTATGLPQGVMVRTNDGAWTDGEGTTIEQGRATNPTTVMVTVRVADRTPETWKQALNLELRDAR